MFPLKEDSLTPLHIPNFINHKPLSMEDILFNLKGAASTLEVGAPVKLDYRPCKACPDALDFNLSPEFGHVLNGL